MIVAALLAMATTLDATMLGTCIRKVLENVTFPTGQTHRLNLRLH